MPFLKAKDIERELEAIEAEIADCDDVEFRRSVSALLLETKKMHNFLKKNRAYPIRFSL